MFYIQCGSERIEMLSESNETPEQTIMKTFGWLLIPIIQKTKSYQKALEKLNWKIVEKGN